MRARLSVGVGHIVCRRLRHPGLEAQRDGLLLWRETDAEACSGARMRVTLIKFDTYHSHYFLAVSYRWQSAARRAPAALPRPLLRTGGARPAAAPQRRPVAARPTGRARSTDAPCPSRQTPGRGPRGAAPPRLQSGADQQLRLPQLRLRPTSGRRRPAPWVVRGCHQDMCEPSIFLLPCPAAVFKIHGSRTQGVDHGSQPCPALVTAAAALGAAAPRAAHGWYGQT
jgi:hypothetical protein